MMRAMSEVERFDVVIVGMGPVGATLACLLGRAGLSIAILDRETVIFDKPRAIVLDHEALRVLQFCGLSDEFFASVVPHTGTNFIGVDGQLIKLFDPKAPPFELGWPPNVMFIQPELEEALTEAMARQPGISARRGWNVSGITQDEHGVTLDVTNDAGIVQVLGADWVVGADGANSLVRQIAGLALEDLDFAEWWVVIDAWLTTDIELPRKTTQYCQPRRPATYVVGPRNLRRWEIKLLPGEEPADFRTDEGARRLLKDFVDVGSLDLWRTAVYRFRATTARAWRNRRLLIAGDAAHTMPPFLAQGLCAGIRDTINLAWKLVHVIRGADASLLDTYGDERGPHVRQIVHHAKEFGLIIGELDADRAARRDAELEAALRNGTATTERQAFVPGLQGGLLDQESSAAGTLFVQPMIETEYGQDLMDNVVGPDFLIVASTSEALTLDRELAEDWAAIGGRRFVLADAAVADRTIERLREVDGRVAAWLNNLGAACAVIRPDRYVYGATSNTRELGRLVTDIVAALKPRAKQPSAKRRRLPGLGREEV